MANGTPSDPSSTDAAAPTPQLHLEIETKLEIDAAAVLPDPLRHTAVRRAGIASATAPVVYELDAVYYDTDRLDLLRSKVTLRRRTGGEDAGWHLKLPGGSAAAGARTEVQLPLANGDTVPAQLAQLIRGTARGRRLTPVARLQNRRTVTRLLDVDGNQAVEIADDAVAASQPDGERIDRWREVEVELIDGTDDQLTATVAALIDAGARAAGRASKLSRALPLRADPEPSPESVSAIVLAGLGRYRDKLIIADRALRQQAPDAVHDARAAARRIRSVLRVYEGMFRQAPVDSLRERLRELGHTLGAARDLDVLRARIEAGLADEPEEFGRPTGMLLGRELDRRSIDARHEIHRTIDGNDYLGLLRDLDEFLLHPQLTGRSGKTAGTELSRQLGRSWRRLRTLAGAALADPENSHAVHAVRKAAMTVRYAAEPTIPVLGEQAAVFAAALQQIQRVLGEYQDAQATAGTLVELAADAATDGIAGFTFGRLHAMEQAMAAGAIDEFASVWDRVQDAELAIALTRD